jgi:hypothetical protein
MAEQQTKKTASSESKQLKKLIALAVILIFGLSLFGVGMFLGIKECKNSSSTPKKSQLSIFKGSSQQNLTMNKTSLNKKGPINLFSLNNLPKKKNATLNDKPLNRL